MAETTATLQKKLLGLTGGKVDIMIDENTFKNSTQILREMSAAWVDMTDIQRAAALELMGGKRQANILSAIIQNFDTVESVIQTSAEASGSALQENEKYLDSIQGRIDLFNNSLQTMWSNELDSDWIKWFVEFGKVIVETIDSIGLLPTAFIAVSVAIMKMNKMNLVEYFGSISDGILGLVSKLRNFVLNIAGVSTAQSTLTATTLQQSVATNILTASEAARIATENGLKMSITQLNAAEALNMLTKSGMAEADALAIITKLGLSSATEELNKKTLAATMFNMGYTPTEIAAAQAALFGAGANQTLAASFTTLWASMWPILAAMAGIAVIYGIVKLFDAIIVSAEEASEQLQETKNVISSLESELESLQTSLDETKEKIAELTSLPSLSLTQQEDLDRLEREVELLERQIALKERQLAIEENELVEDAETAIDKKFYGTGSDKAYIVTNSGVIKKDKWYTGGKSGKDVIDEAIKKYENKSEDIQTLESLLPKWENWSSSERYDAIKDMNNAASYYGIYTADDDLQQIIDGINKAESEKANIASSIEEFFNDPDYSNLTYGMSDDINTFLDDFNNAQLRWEKALYGDNSTAKSIESLWGPNASEEMKTVKNEIDKIMAEEGNWASDEEKWQSKNETIQKYINSLDTTADGYHQLDYVMNDLGVTTQDIADYFTVLNGEFNSSTIEGITKQYADALETMNHIKNMGVDGSFTVGENKYDWDDFFSENDEGRFEARVDKFAEILKGMDKETRNTFTSLMESIKNGELTWEQAMKSFEHSGNLAGLKVIESQIIELNKVEFSNISDEISGVIDTFGELSSALEDVASSMELLNTAQTQMNNSGRISVKTALEIMQSTDQWNEILEIENGNIRLVGNATEILVENKLALIKANLQNALSTVTEQLAMIDSQNASEDLATTMEESTNQAVRKLAGSMAYLTKMMEAYTKIANGETVDTSWYIDEAKKMQSQAESDLNWKLNSANKVGKENLEKRRDEIKAQLEMLAGIDTTSEFKNNYDYDETPGDKYDETSGALDAITKKYESRIKNLENKQTYIENEIEKLEEEDAAVSADYYEEQIDLEEKKINLYQQEYEELLKLERTDEVAERIWEVAHAIQEATTNVIKFRKSITQLYEEAFSDVMDAYANKDDFTGDQQSYIEKYMNFMKLQGEDIDKNGYQSLIDIETKRISDNQSKLATLQSGLAQGLADGSIKEGDTLWTKIQDDIRHTELDILDSKTNIAEYTKSIKELVVEDFSDSRRMFGYKDQFLTNQQNYIEGYIEQLETSGIDVPQEAYEELINIETQKRANKVSDLVDARKDLEELEAQGYTAADQEWQDAYQNVVDLEKGIQQCDTNTAKWTNTILDMDFSRLEEFLKLLQDINTEVDNFDDIVSREEAYNDDGTWTEAGITSVGLKYQKYTNAENRAKHYGAEIDKIDEAWANGTEYDADGDGKGEILTKEKYDEYRKILVDGQWDSLKEMYNAKDDMIAMEEARIDQIEENVNREVEAYQELIDIKQEELDAERDLYEFKKDVEKQTKDIASLERRIASLSGSTNAADIAERRKLEAELYEVRDGLNDTYYNHAKDSQSKALDDEMSAFEESMNDFVESLREGLKDTEKVFEDLVVLIGLNADTIYKNVNDVSEKNGIKLSDLLTGPWAAAGEAAIEYKEGLGSVLNPLVGEGGVITLFSTTASTLLTKPFLDATAENGPIAVFESKASQAILGVKLKVNGEDGNSNYLGNGLSKPWEDATAEDGPIATFDKNVGDAINAAITKVSGENNEGYLGNKLDAPWETDAPNTFADNVGTALDKAIKTAEEKIPKLKEKLNEGVPDISGNGNTGDTSTSTPDNGTKKGYDNGNLTAEQIKEMQTFLGVTVDGKWGTKSQGAAKTKWDVTSADEAWNKFVPKNTGIFTSEQRILGSQSFVDDNTVVINGVKYYVDDDDLYYKIDDLKTVKYDGGRSTGWAIPKKTAIYKQYAKGTLGTKKDEWAITDESWIGEEITLAAGKNGQLQYLKKGSAVMPADISANLVEWGKLNPNMMDLTNPTTNINMINNAVSKPELNLTFDSLVHVDHCDEDTLKNLEKMVDTKINDFSKQLNYSVKKFAR